MTISGFSIRYRTTVLVFMAILAIVGVYSYVVMPREAAPDIPIPYVTVTTSYEGASPSDIESLITRPIERKLKGMKSVKEMRSVSAEGMSVIVVEFDIRENIDRALQRVKDKVDMAKPDLPAEVDDPIVQEINISEFPIMFISISGDLGLPKLKQIAEDLEDKIDPIPGVLDAVIVGGLEREIHVEFDPDRLAAYGLNPGEVIATVRASNLNTPGGTLKIGEAKYTLKVPAEFQSPAEVAHLVVAVRNGKPIYLTDICRVADGYKDQDAYARIDGKDAVTVVVVKRSGENLLKISDEVKALLANEVFPPTVKISITADESKMIRNMVSDLENNMLSALVLVVGVMLVALSYRVAMFVAIAIPFSLFSALALLHATGVTMNMVVLFSLVLVLGMLVDCAIVVCENIYRHYSMGKGLVEAAVGGAAEMSGPVAGSTLTTVAAFTPLLFWPDLIGKFLSFLPKTVIIALMASMFVALVMNPVLCALWMGKRPALPGDLESRLARSRVFRIYRRFLAWSLRHRLFVVFCSFSALVGTVMAYQKLGMGVIFFPETDPNRAYVSLKAP
ncbi:efflux RND transporter permease subunit, partial [Candidatus Sumerlaeota bacterium]|nr:efflux RND transporter permease subunit [Candidatus Sumerlaeota bacterium]